MNEDQLRIRLEQIGVDSDKIDEAVDVLSGTKYLDETVKKDEISNLKERYDTTIDWREKAKLAAQMITNDLST